MHLNHLNLTVTNVSEAIYLFETYFDFKCVATKGNNMIAILKGIDDFELVLMSATMNQKGNTSYPDAFHIGFMLDDPEYVVKIYKKLKAGGITLEREPKKIRDNFGFYFHFDTLMIEIGAALSDEDDEDITLDSSVRSI
ncbi:MAG TPA: VOC family protein [Ferruginibacter sp.]|jgi:catechol 2,3-dioxygenase-like lactoylglutathione lyase family enzyme|nr:VOC family protein [Ferruginibacter sp.]